MAFRGTLVCDVYFYPDKRGERKRDSNNFLHSYLPTDKGNEPNSNLVARIEGLSNEAVSIIQAHILAPAKCHQRVTRAELIKLLQEKA